ncbi:MAG: UDP-N-acetylmuramoyl-L-alanyl-D-glutamate--2,6-diaminopimelate ligase [Lentisphaeria bacterium]|nr:UDP-N-acetylmuramoyl-L-alanyl-D-glutamate--2,6-diaminopimelate ligase [Lentisphaeria bacterium]
MKQVSELAAALPDGMIRGGGPFAASGITADSRQVRPGMIYAAIPGVARDGHDFLPSAIASGAAALLVSCPERVPEDCPVPVWQTASPRAAYARLVREFAGRPDESLDLFGVTGTNGKTTTAFLVHSLLTACGRRGGLFSTVEFRTPGGREASTHTTPDPDGFYRLLGRTVAEGGDFAAMELSSHSLAQHRTDGVGFRSAVFTNFTGDHLDYHRTMENYFAAKQRLFTGLMAADGQAVINCDDPAGARLAADCPRPVITYGTGADADCRITGIALAAGGSRCCLHYRGRDWPLATPLAGKHNLYNLAGALLGAEAMGADWETLLAAVPHCRPVPGRLQAVTIGGVVFYVDYAHTDDALTQVLTALRQIAPRRIIVVFGCGGDRDRSKRPRMAQAVAAGADLAIVTNDNPRSEDPMAIITEICGGFPADFAREMQPDRAAAIRLAAGIARPGDLVLIAGKGHEDYQEINGIRHPFSDWSVLQELAAR